MSFQPIIYVSTIDVRCSDLDSYGHVNSAHYLDYVSSARLHFLEQNFGMSLDDFAKKGTGIFITKVTQNFKRPINGLKKVLVESFVKSLDGTRAIVDYKILSLDRAVTHTFGEFEFAIVDLQSGKSVAMPSWMHDVFYVKEQSEKQPEVFV